MTLSCNTGDFATPSFYQGTQKFLCVNSDYLLSHKDRGFVASLGSTTKATISSNLEFGD
jgi:hypothetical protein